MSTKAKRKSTKKAAKAAPKVDKQSAPDAAHVTYMKEQLKELGPCGAVRALAKKYSSLKRADVIAIAEACGINRATASTQFQQARTA